MTQADSVHSTPPTNTSPTRRNILGTIAALPIAAAMPTIAPAMPLSSDPIFAVVDEFRRADADLAAAFGPLQEEDVIDKLWVRQEAAYESVIRTRPTTPAGLAALTTWARERMDWLRKNGSSLEGDKLFELSAAIDDAARGMSGLQPWSPPPALPHVADPVISLAQRAIDAWNDFEEKCSATSKAEELVIDWRNLNPRPELRPLTVGSIEDYLAFKAGLSTFDPNADLRAAGSELQAAVNDWAKKRRLVEKETGYIRADRAQKRASNRFDEIRDELTDVRPTSIAGLRAKAHAARVSSDEGLQQQIVFDIGVLFGDLDSNEKPVVVQS